MNDFLRNCNGKRAHLEVKGLVGLIHFMKPRNRCSHLGDRRAKVSKKWRALIILGISEYVQKAFLKYFHTCGISHLWLICLYTKSNNSTIVSIYNEPLFYLIFLSFWACQVFMKTWEYCSGSTVHSSLWEIPKGNL